MSERKLNKNQLEKLLRSGQTAPTRLLETYLGQLNFQRKSQRGSHIKFENSQSGETFIIVAGSSNLLYQRKVARLAVDTIGSKESARELPSVPPAVKSPPRFLAVMDALPPDFEAIPAGERENTLILRLKELPQIGALVPSLMAEPALKALCDSIRKEESDFISALKAATEKLELQVWRDEDKNLIIRQPHYDYNISMPAFRDAASRASGDYLDEAVLMVELADSAIKTAVQQFISSHDALGQVARQSLENGDIKHTVRHRSEIHQKELTIQISTSRDLRIDPFAWYATLDKMFEADFDPSNSKFLSTVLNRRFGFTVSRPAQGKVLGSELFFKHPFYSDLTFFVPVPSALPTFKQLMHKYFSDEGSDAANEGAVKMVELIEKRKTIYDVTRQAIELFLKQAEATNDQFEAYVGKALTSLGLKGRFSPPSPKLGEQFDAVYTHPDLTDTIVLGCISVQKDYPTPAGKPLYMVNPADLQKAEDSLRRFEIDQRRKHEGGQNRLFDPGKPGPGG